MNIQIEERPKNITSVEELSKAFETFNKAAEKMQEYYSFLEKRVEELNIELEDKNKVLEQNLKEKEKLSNYLENVLESLTVGIVGVNNDSKITFINSRLEDFFMIDKESLKGQNVVDVFSPHFPESILHDAMAEGFSKNKFFEFTHQIDQDSSKREMRVSIIKETDTKDSIIGGLIIFEDISEIRRLERQGLLRNRLQAMGEIAVNVAHEVRNPLGSIELFASMLRQDLEALPHQQSIVDNILIGVRGIDNIVSNILHYTRSKNIYKSSKDLIQIIDESILFVEHPIRQKEIKINREINQEECFVNIDSELLKQAFLNILLNSIQAVKIGGNLWIKLIDLGDKIEVHFSDDGKGIPKDMIGKIFDPFFTTKKRGTGLGLTIVHNIISAHGGMIEVEPRAHGGTTFIITLQR